MLSVKQDRETSTVVVFTNADAIKSVKVEHTGKLAANAPAAKELLIC